MNYLPCYWPAGLQHLVVSQGHCGMQTKSCSRHVPIWVVKFILYCKRDFQVINIVTWAINSSFPFECHLEPLYTIDQQYCFYNFYFHLFILFTHTQRQSHCHHICPIVQGYSTLTLVQSHRKITY